MKKQVVMIHGGHAVGEYSDFLSRIKTEEIDKPFSDRPKRWSQSLRKTLGNEYEVCTPEMPNKQNAQYNEWEVWFERHFEFLHDGVVLVGWSLGGIFLAKYLSEHKLPFHIESLYLVAPVFSFDDLDEGKENTFSFEPSTLSHLAKQVKNIHIFHSKDDFVVPYAHAQMYMEALPSATLHTFENRNHFLQEEFPELIQEIRKVG